MVFRARDGIAVEIYMVVAWEKSLKMSFSLYEFSKPPLFRFWEHWSPLKTDISLRFQVFERHFLQNEMNVPAPPPTQKSHHADEGREKVAQAIDYYLYFPELLVLLY